MKKVINSIIEIVENKIKPNPNSLIKKKSKFLNFKKNENGVK